MSRGRSFCHLSSEDVASVIRHLDRPPPPADVVRIVCGLRNQVALSNENTLMIVGLQTNFCIDATVKSAFERGYKVIVPAGAKAMSVGSEIAAETLMHYGGF